MQLINFSVLEQFIELLGDDGKAEARDLVKLYLEDAPEQIKNMQQGLENQDTELFRRAAHTFKSSSANVGADGLQSLCQDMENRATEGQTESLSSMLKETLVQYDQVKDALQAWCHDQY